MRLRRAEYRDHTRRCCVGTGAHVHGRNGEPDGVDADD